MRNRLLKSLILLALAGASTAVLAQEVPGRVGRIALTQGSVTVNADGEQTAAQVNWPVTSGEMITTGRGARTELQVGAAFIRLDGDSSIEVLELDDDSLRLRLHYGSASIRVLDADTLAGFELTTPEGRVTLQEPGEVRIDAERIADTSSVTVLSGVARVEGGGANLTLRTGKRADIRDDDVRTLAAGRDPFDDWVAARDRVVDAPTSVRYVSQDMTGYADLDRYGNWQTDPEYGALWFPSSVGPGWVPYSDGSWCWIAPWGWTWVDNAPWGYAPFHYGRWVFTHNRWGWVPGHREHHPVWSPALVGWVGGSNWSMGFSFNNRHQSMPARGWYPLTPHDRFEPSYHVRDDYLRRLNHDVRPDPRHRGEEHRGVTVVPQEHFGQRGRVPVANVPHTTVPPQVAQRAPVGAPPAPPPSARFVDRDWRGQDRRGDERFGRGQQMPERFEHRGDGGRRSDGVPVLTAPSMPQAPRAAEQRPPQAMPAAAMPPAPAQPAPQWRDRRDEERRAMPQQAQEAAAQPAPPQWRDRRDEERRAMPQPAPQATAPQAIPAQVPPPQWRERRDDERERRGMQDRFERRHEQPSPPPAPVAAAQPVSNFPVPQPVVPNYQPMRPPPPVVPQVQPMQAPPPVIPQQRPVIPAAAQPAPAPAAAPAPQREEHHGGRHDDRRDDRRDERRQQDR